MNRFGGVGLLMLVSSVAGAQRGISSRGMGGGNGINLSRGPAVEIPKYINPIMLLIQHRQDLALNDTQWTNVIRIKRTVDSTDVPLMRRLDSVQVLFKGAGPLFGSPGPERRDSLASARAVVRETIAYVRENLADAREKAFSMLSASQIAKAEEFEKKEQVAIDEENKKKPDDAGRSGIGARRPPD